jgi:hypothetical protein
MYHPRGDQVQSEFLELYNATSQDIDLNGWRIIRGVDYVFSQATVPANGYLILAADIAAFADEYPGVANVVGPWTGKLSNQGETIELVDTAGTIVDQVRYADQGDWAIRREDEPDHGHRGWTWYAEHDGGGKSLELVNWRLPNEHGQNWGSSLPDGGSPGRLNSISSLNIAPLIAGVTHDPPLPRSSESIAITAMLLDEATALAEAFVVYRRDGELPEYRLPLVDDGMSRDGAAGDGVFGAVLPPQPDATRLQFRVEVTDATGQQRIWPLAESASDGARPDALIVVSDAAPLSADLLPGDQPIHHLVMTTTEQQELADIGDGPLEEAESNAAMNATLIHVDGSGVEIRYLVSVRNRGGSSRIGPPNNYRVEFSHDRPWRGSTAINLNCQYVHAQILGSVLYRAAGIPAATALPVKVFVNGQDAAESEGPRMFGSFAQLQVIDGDFIDDQFPDDSAGNLYRAVVAGTQSGDLRDEGPAADAYRDTYLKRTNESLDDWGDLIGLVDALSSLPDGQFLARVEQVIDLDQWMRFLALDSLLGNRETGLSFGTGDNYWLYRGLDDTRFRLIPHDLDTIMGNGRLPQPNRSIFAYTAVPGLTRLLTHPDTVPHYYRAFLELMDQLYRPERLDPLIDQTLSGFVVEQEILELKQFVRDRIEGVVAQLPHEFVISSPLPTVNGLHRTTLPLAELEGTAYAVETQSVLVNGQLADWSPLTHQWSLRPRGEGRTELLIARGANWTYLDDGSDPQTRWRTSDFDDSQWLAGAAPLGYGYGNQATHVGFGPNVNDKFITTYYRRTFQVDDPADILDVALHLQVDDGAVVYLNGREVARLNMPPGTLDFQTLASRWIGSTPDDTIQSIQLDGQLLQAGSNLLAVEVHQRSATDNDLWLDLALEAHVGRLSGGIPLNPGVNRILVQAMDGPAGSGETVDEGFIDVWYDGSTVQDPGLCARLQQEGHLAPQTLAAGTLTSDTTLAPCGPAYQVTGEVVVPAGVNLTILPGTSLFFSTDAGLVVDGGQLIAEGSSAAPIRFTRTPGSNGAWRGIQLRNTLLDNRLKHAVLEYGVSDQGMLGVDGSVLTVDHATFDHTDLFRIRAVNASLVVTNSVFTDIYGPDEEPTTDNRSEHIWGSGILEGGQMLIQGNRFGTTKGHNDAVDFDGARRPAAIPRIIDNYFAGGGDDALDLETDAHIEGNTFTNIHKDIYNSSTGDANAISAGAGREYVVVRNVFHDVDHAVQVKDEAFLTFDHNTVSRVAKSAIFFELDERGPGRGADVTDSIFDNVAAAFAAMGPTTELSVNRSIVPADAIGLGADNTSESPRLRDAASGDFTLAAGSSARSSGLFGSDRGALVRPGPLVQGQPSRFTDRRDAVLHLGGPSWLAYRYRVNSGAWSEPRDLAQPITLTNLPDGDVTVFVIGQDSAGTWQSDERAVASQTWTIEAGRQLLRINELSANNASSNATIQTWDWIELYNGGSSPVDLSGMSLTDNAALPRQFVFPSQTFIQPNGFLLVAADELPRGGMLPTGFRLNAEGEGVYLFDRPDRGGALLDDVEYGLQIPDSTIGRLGIDGQWQLNHPTPGASNIARPTGDVARLSINEWLARPGMRVRDEYLELFNADSLPVDLGGLALTDDTVAHQNRHRIANLSFIAGLGVSQFVTDGNVAAGPNHLNFELDGDHELLGLYNVSGRAIDQVVTLHQLSGVSHGRSPDGATSLAFFTLPTPGIANPAPASEQTELLPFGGHWRYSAVGSLPGAGWYSETFDDSGWTSGAGAFAAGAQPANHPVGTALPLGAVTYYFRQTVTISPEWLQENTDLTVEMRTLVDDGVQVFVNGVSVLRLGLHAGEINYDTRANRGVGVAVEEGPFVIPAGALRAGTNTVAVEVHQISPSNSDVVFDMQLQATVTRRDTFLDNAQQLLDALRVTELMYHPADDGAAEFIELSNRGAKAIDLTGVRVRGGIDFTFAAATLQPDEVAVIVRDRTTFQSVYGTSRRILGEYSGALSNGNDDFVVSLPEPLDVEIQLVAYDDHWYPQTDGSGRSLMARPQPTVPGVWEQAADWQPSQRWGGTPGEDNNRDLVGDFDHDTVLSPLDLNVICAALVSLSSDAEFDVNNDQQVDRNDAEFLLQSVFHTTPGDVNLDRHFDSSDLVSVFQEGLFERGPAVGATWTSGDWNCDGQFDTSDLVYVFQTSRYEL